MGGARRRGDYPGGVTIPVPSTDRLAAHAATLRALHRPGRPLVLPNVWDASSAGLVAGAGHPALATSSSAVAAALGWEDGERTPPAEMFAAIGRIARVADVPLTADIEAGYGMEPADVVAHLLGAGASGCNLEDSIAGSRRLRPVEEQVERLRGVRAAADAAGVPIVLNARVDVFLPGRGEGLDAVDEAIARGRRYIAAGADCVYPIMAPPDVLPRLVEGIAGPVNAIAKADRAAIERVAATGVARISLGGNLFDAARERMRELIDGLAPA
jgi:2-methylisocitrate lyase-like PEP mutase family enzyme